MKVGQVIKQNKWTIILRNFWFVLMELHNQFNKYVMEEIYININNLYWFRSTWDYVQFFTIYQVLLTIINPKTNITLRFVYIFSRSISLGDETKWDKDTFHYFLLISVVKKCILIFIFDKYKFLLHPYIYIYIYIYMENG